MKRKRERTSLTGMSEEEGPANTHTHIHTQAEKFTHHLGSHDFALMAHTHTHTL